MFLYIKKKMCRSKSLITYLYSHSKHDVYMYIKERCILPRAVSLSGFFFNNPRKIWICKGESGSNLKFVYLKQKI